MGASELAEGVKTAPACECSEPRGQESPMESLGGVWEVLGVRPRNPTTPRVLSGPSSCTDSGEGWTRSPRVFNIFTKTFSCPPWLASVTGRTLAPAINVS